MSNLDVCILLINTFVTVVVIFARLHFNHEVKRTVNVLSELGKPIQEPFSLSKYYERLIQVSEEIAEEKAKQKYEPTVLWLLLDGLRINEDGTIEWIKKPSRTNKILDEVKKKEKEREPYEQLIDKCMGRGYSPYTIPSSALYADDGLIFMSGVENCSVEDRLRMQYAQLQSNLASQMADLQNQMQSQVLINTMVKSRFDAYGQCFEGEPLDSLGARTVNKITKEEKQ